MIWKFSGFECKKSGFTLIEVLVSIVISTMVLTAVLNSYFQSLRVHARLDVTRQLQKEVHFALIRMADKIRDLSVDYGEYLSVDGVGGDCFGQDMNVGSRLCLRGDVVFGVEDGRLEMSESPLLSSRFVVEDLRFTVTPEEDLGLIESGRTLTLDKVRALSLQPKVEVFLRVKSLGQDDVELALRTTISSRIYE